MRTAQGRKSREKTKLKAAPLRSIDTDGSERYGYPVRRMLYHGPARRART
jgi:hypothetical protein